MLKSTLFLNFLAFCLVPIGLSNPVTYRVSVNTSSLVGTDGSLDFNFNPGPLLTQPASLQIFGVGGDGMPTGIPATTGDIVGALPAMLTFDNGAGFNDYFQGFTFGSSLSFDVSLDGPALSSPDGTSTSGSTFAFSIFSDTAGTVPALTTDTVNGFAVTVDVNLDGTTTVIDTSAQTTVAQLGGSNPVPEPSTFLPLLSITFWLAFLFWKSNRSKVNSRERRQGGSRSPRLPKTCRLSQIENLDRNLKKRFVG